MASCQFYGKETVLEAYRNCNIPSWGLFSGKQLLCRYNDFSIDEGASLLDEFLSKIECSSATYTLKVFEIKAGQKVKEKSECDSSFNFKIPDQDSYNERVAGYDERRNRLTETLAGINKRLELIENNAKEIGEEEGEEGEEESLFAKIGAVLEQSILKVIENPQEPNIITSIFGNLFNNGQQFKPTLGHIGEINKPNNAETMSTEPIFKGENDSEEKLKRLSEAINILETHDPLIVEHLEKLAKLAQSNSRKFKGLLTTLDIML